MTQWCGEILNVNSITSNTVTLTTQLFIESETFTTPITRSAQSPNLISDSAPISERETVIIVRTHRFCRQSIFTRSSWVLTNENPSEANQTIIIMCVSKIIIIIGIKQPKLVLCKLKPIMIFFDHNFMTVDFAVY